ncbi:NUDIX hydrolase [Streptomyces sp. NPDC056169]|uniref:NUDIX hydrolase n=1 Tax=Streptomyces sp. NPDC056169 TaxID=3345734 RepID=UPI0035DF5247
MADQWGDPARSPPHGCHPVASTQLRLLQWSFRRKTSQSAWPWPDHQGDTEVRWTRSWKGGGRSSHWPSRLLPGGHLEASDGTLLQAAGREPTEETGIPPHVVTPHSQTSLHIDVHPIDANPAKDEPAHQHFDFRFLFRTTADIGEIQTEEVSDAAWRDVDEITDPQLRHRIATALLDADSDAAMNGQLPLAGPWPLAGE